MSEQEIPAEPTGGGPFTEPSFKPAWDIAVPAAGEEAPQIVASTADSFDVAAAEIPAEATKLVEAAKNEPTETMETFKQPKKATKKKAK